MSRILLADDSPHAQRMGERILRDEGYEVVTVTDGQTAVMRLADVDPDVVLADISLPRVSGYDICRQIKATGRFAHVKVILTAGLLEAFDDDRAASVRADAVLKKPFEASVLLEAIRPLVEVAEAERSSSPSAAQPFAAVPVRVVTGPDMGAPAAAVDPERVRAAVTLALDAALPSMIDKITERVLIALGH